MGKFPLRRRWILFLRASYFRSRYNKVPSFDKTSSHEFPATCEDVNIDGAGARAREKAPFTESTKRARADIWSLAAAAEIFPLVLGKPLSREGASDYRPFRARASAMTGIFDGRISSSSRRRYLSCIWRLAGANGDSKPKRNIISGKARVTAVTYGRLEAEMEQVAYRR